nr:hypothetical protein [Brevibacillus laterosporus]
MKIKARGAKNVAKSLDIDSRELGRLFKTLDKENFERKISITMIDSLTEYLGLPDGYYYPKFLGELRRKPNKRGEAHEGKGAFMEDKTKEFIKRCLEVENYELVSRIIEMICQEKSIKVVFELAEDIFNLAEKKYPYDSLTVNYEKPEYLQCLYLYNTIIEKEKSFSTFLAVCHLRKYYLLRFDRKQVHELLNNMKMFIKFMSDDEQLNAYERLCGYYKLYFKWSELYEASTTLGNMAKNVDTDRYGFALISKGFALNGLGRYDETFDVISQYEQLSEFKYEARMNRLITKAHIGDLEALKDLTILAMRFRSPEKESTLAIVIENYAKVGEYEKALEIMRECNATLYLDSDNTTHVAFKIMRFKRAEGIVLLQTGNEKKGLDKIIEAAKMALNLKITPDFGELIAIFNQNIQFASTKQKNTLINMYTILERR